MKAPRVKAKDVQVGDLILTSYYWRTWKPVTATVIEARYQDGELSVRVDTTSCRVWFSPDDPVPCKRGPA